MISDFNWMKRMLSHNVRMPSAVISGYGELLRQELLTPEEQKKAILDICENITYINDLLCLVLEDGTQNEAAERVELGAQLKQMQRYVCEAAKQDSIQIVLYTEKPKMYVSMPQLALMRVFYQLFENAMKYMDGGSQIAVRAYCVEEEQLLVVFKNDGRGISEKEASRVFESGFRGSNSNGRAGSGSGLAEIKQIMERYGGSIDASSGKSSGFSVFLMFPKYREEGM